MQAARAVDVQGLETYRHSAASFQSDRGRSPLSCRQQHAEVAAAVVLCGNKARDGDLGGGAVI
jgi:hypothetical protein